jgi:hypothetical protein
MNRPEIESLIDSKIRGHEIRVAIVSGILGLALLAGTFHAIAILNHERLRELIQG